MRSAARRVEEEFVEGSEEEGRMVLWTDSAVRRSKRRESGAAQRGKGAVKQHTVRGIGKRSKREREWCAHREEKCSKRGE